MTPQDTNANGFDVHAAHYEDELEQGLSLSGESREYYADRRASWTARCLRTLNRPAGRLLDYGCGNGASAPALLKALAPESMVGLDNSRLSIQLAQQHHGGPFVQFLHIDDFKSQAEFQTAYSNGTFHHIPPSERNRTLAGLYHALAPGSIFALWENNPWNPGTRLVMRRIPFDRDAIPMSSCEARQRLRAAGFTILRTDFLFFFPRLLAWFRPIEPWLSSVPLGGQYQILAQKPGGASV